MSVTKLFQTIQHKHLAILGNTQSGKTTLAKELFFQKDDELSLFIDTQAKISFSETDVISDDPKEAIIIMHDTGKAVFRPKILLKEKNEDDVWTLLDLLVRYQQLTGLEEHVRLYMDEIQSLVPNLASSSNPFLQLISRGLNYKIQVVTITQTPTLMNKVFLSQSVNFIGIQHPYYHNWLQKIGYDQIPSQPFVFSVYDGISFLYQFKTELAY